MSNFFYQAAEINNEGIIALQAGDDEAAVSYFKESLTFLKKELSAEQYQQPKQTKFGCGLREASTVEVSTSDENDDTTGFYHAIVLPLDEQIQNEQSYTLHLHVYSAAVVFNLAIAHHHMANNGAASCVSKAEKLYSSALKILDDTSFQMRTAFLIKLGSINNLAILRVDNGEYEKASEGLSHIAECLANSTDALLDEPEINTLLRNVLFIRVPQAAPAA